MKLVRCLCFNNTRFLMNEFTISFWGQFKNKDTEQSFLNRIATDINNHNRVAIAVAGLSFALVTFADYAKLGFVQGFYYTLTLRIMFLAFCLTIFGLLKHNQSIRKTYLFSFLVAIVMSSVLISLIYFLNPDKEIDTIDQITVPVVTLLCYIFLNIRTIHLVVNGVYITVIYILMLTFAMNTPVDNVINILVIMIVINFMGLYLNRFLDISRRKEYAHKSTIENLNEDLKKEVEERKSTQYSLEFALRQITDSIKYAQNIQLALMPSNKILINTFSDYALVYRPKNIVSGDFYWLHKIENKTIVAVADCTGHGIPGAFMSVLGISLLNEIVKSAETRHEFLNANQILNQLRDEVIQSLRQSGRSSERRDGMDISVIIIDKEKNNVQFAGAYNPAWLIKRNQSDIELVEFPADKMPIGLHSKTVLPFNSVEHAYGKGDFVYLFTDGFEDQFGGHDGRKFLRKNFKDLIVSFHDTPLLEQKKSISDAFDIWKGDKYQQVDDVLILGIEL